MLILTNLERRKEFKVQKKIKQAQEEEEKRLESTQKPSRSSRNASTVKSPTSKHIRSSKSEISVKVMKKSGTVFIHLNIRYIQNQQEQCTNRLTLGLNQPELIRKIIIFNQI